MKRSLFFPMLLVLGASPCFAQWSIVSHSTRPMLNQTRSDGEDVWLDVVIRNDSRDTLYVHGIKWEQPWYLVEAYLKHADNEVWIRQNIGVDQKLQMLPVKAGQTFKVVRREDKQSIGQSMMLTFRNR